MSKEKKKSPFSIYWIYAALGFALIAFQLYVSSDSVATIKSRETFFKESQRLLKHVSNIFGF